MTDFFVIDGDKISKHIALKTHHCYSTTIYFGIMMDILQIKGLSVQTHIGVYAWEQQILQRLLIDISIPGDFSTCHDNITNTVDYDKLCQQVTTYVELNSFQLIETVADKIANLIKQEFNVPQLTVSVSKPHAIKNASDIRVTITR